jgi:hypothetical protein
MVSRWTKSLSGKYFNPVSGHFVITVSRIDKSSDPSLPMNNCQLLSARII